MIDHNHDTCVVHQSPRATEEDPNVCWRYDGTADCRFTPTQELGSPRVIGPGVHYGGAVSVIRGRYRIQAIEDGGL